MLKQNTEFRSDVPIQTQRPMLNIRDEGVKRTVDHGPEAVVGPESEEGEDEEERLSRYRLPFPSPSVVV